MNTWSSEKLIAAVSDYKLLEPAVLGGGGATQNVASFTAYFSAIIRTTLVLGVFAAVLMIVIGGIQKILSKTPAGQGDGNDKIRGALVGLFLLIISATILATINPNLLNLNFFTPGAATPLTEVDPVRPPSDPTRPPDGPTLPGNAREATAADRTGQGNGTEFGYNDSLDNGEGAARLNPNSSEFGINTNNPTVRGVALPQEVIERTLGIPPNSGYRAWAPARNAGVRVTNSQGQSVIVPIVDLGPSDEQRAEGDVIDQTHAVNQELGGDGPRTYEIIPDYYLTNPRP